MRGEYNINICTYRYVSWVLLYKTFRKTCYINFTCNTFQSCSGHSRYYSVSKHCFSSWSQNNSHWMWPRKTPVCLWMGWSSLTTYNSWLKKLDGWPSYIPFWSVCTGVCPCHPPHGARPAVPPEPPYTSCWPRSRPTWVTAPPTSAAGGSATVGVPGTPYCHTQPHRKSGLNG